MCLVVPLGKTPVVLCKFAKNLALFSGTAESLGIFALRLYVFCIFVEGGLFLYGESFLFGLCGYPTVQKEEGGLSCAGN